MTDIVPQRLGEKRMSRYMDEDVFLEKFDHIPMVQDALKSAFDTMPYINLVKCKDCVNCLNYDKLSLRNWCAVNDTTVHLDDYCSWGERRKNKG